MYWYLLGLSIHFSDQVYALKLVIRVKPSFWTDSFYLRLGAFYT